MAVIDSHILYRKKWRNHNGKDNGKNSSTM